MMNFGSSTDRFIPVKTFFFNKQIIFVVEKNLYLLSAGLLYILIGSFVFCSRTGQLMVELVAVASLVLTALYIFTLFVFLTDNIGF